MFSMIHCILHYPVNPPGHSQNGKSHINSRNTTTNARYPSETDNPSKATNKPTGKLSTTPPKPTGSSASHLAKDAKIEPKPKFKRTEKFITKSGSKPTEIKKHMAPKSMDKNTSNGTDSVTADSKPEPASGSAKDSSTPLTKSQTVPPIPIPTDSTISSSRSEDLKLIKPSPKSPAQKGSKAKVESVYPNQSTMKGSKHLEKKSAHSVHKEVKTGMAVTEPTASLRRMDIKTNDQSAKPSKLNPISTKPSAHKLNDAPSEVSTSKEGKSTNSSHPIASATQSQRLEVMGKSDADIAKNVEPELRSQPLDSFSSNENMLAEKNAVPTSSHKADSEKEETDAEPKTLNQSDPGPASGHQSAVDTNSKDTLHATAYNTAMNDITTSGSITGTSSAEVDPLDTSHSSDIEKRVGETPPLVMDTRAINPCLERSLYVC